jgi:hypothetical protein
MSDYYGMAETLRQLETEVNGSMMLDGKAYPCTFGARTDSHDLGMGGFATGATLEIVLRSELFTSQTLPTLNSLVYVNYKAHKVNTINKSPDWSFVVLACDDANKDV